MSIRQQLYDLKAQRAERLTAARSALENDDMQTYSEELQAAQEMNSKIESIENLLAEEERFGKETPNKPLDSNKNNLNEILASREYTRAFTAAVRAGVTPRTARNGEEYGVLLDALKESGGTPEGSDGGFLVPTDMDTMIREYRRQLVALSNLFASETVTAPSGFRVVDKAPTKGFTKVEEMATIAKDDQPSFAKITYTVSKYAMILPVSNELMDDNTAGLMQYLARWFAKKGVITENRELLGKTNDIKAEAATKGEELETIKTALNVTLDPDIALNARFIVNQDAWNALDNLVDGNARPLLQPDPTSATSKMLLSHPIVCMPNSQMPNNSDGTSTILIGDFTQYATLFRKKPLEIASTNIGGNAWSTDSTEVRGIMRMDVEKFDSSAATAIKITV